MGKHEMIVDPSVGVAVLERRDHPFQTVFSEARTLTEASRLLNEAAFEAAVHVPPNVVADLVMAAARLEREARRLAETVPKKPVAANENKRFKH